jgi:hypothetical protein
MSRVSEIGTKVPPGQLKKMPVFIGGDATPLWSDPGNWLGSVVPSGGKKLDIAVEANSRADLGTSRSPFRAGDVIGVADGQPPPDLFISGTLDVDNVLGFGSLRVNNYSEFTVRHDVQAQSVLAEFTHLIVGHDLQANSVVAFDASISVDHDVMAQTVVSMNPSFVTIGHDAVATELRAVGSGRITVQHDLIGTPTVEVRDAAVEIGGDFGGAQFLLEGRGGSLILDRTPSHHLDNLFEISSKLVGGSGLDQSSITLKDLGFDGAQWISAPGSDPNAPASGVIELTKDGSPIYELTNVHASAIPVLSVQNHTLFLSVPAPD